MYSVVTLLGLAGKNGRGTLEAVGHPHLITMMKTTTAWMENGLEERGLASPAFRAAVSPERALARNLKAMAANGDHSAASVSVEDLTALLEAQNQAVADGDLAHVRRLLSNQVTMLERLTDHLFSRAMGMGAVAEVYERYLRLAFRAQAQCLRTATLLKKLTDAASKPKAQKAAPCHKATESRQTENPEPVHQWTATQVEHPTIMAQPEPCGGGD